MSELKRTTQAVDEIEQLVQRVLDAGSDADLQQLSQLVGNTAPTVQKLRQKAAETDPTKQTYGAQTCEKVCALASRWDTVEGLVRDVLQQRGARVAAPAPPAQTSPPAPAPVFSQPSVPPRATPSASQQAAPIEPAARPPASSAAPRPDGPSRRELAARAAEARLQGGAAPAKAPASAAAASSAPAAAAAAAPQAVPVPRVARMDALLHLVHCVFLGHGFVRDEGSEEGRGGAAILQGIGPFRVRYEHKTHRPITATYVPVQSHLVVYADQEGIECVHAPGRAAVQLGMPVESVQAKIDYLLLYPLVYRQCLPAMTSLPPEVCFSVLANLAIPALAAVGRASRGLSSTVFEDDVLWWRVLTALPPSIQLHGKIEEAMNARDRGEAVAPGTYRRLVREEVMRAREEAEQQRQRREAEARMRERLRDPLLVQPPRQPRFPGGPGGFMIGGPYDLAPGGGFLPGPFGPGGGRRPPLGGGGGGFGFGGLF
mmetsp:Transcript_8763/g.27283  ORF Transcript_8763/g.27283 Transcript_8763/m.27283 type:complete len:486 (+) Transcript_8763:124-1581(+)